MRSHPNILGGMVRLFLKYFILDINGTVSLLISHTDCVPLASGCNDCCSPNTLVHNMTQHLHTMQANKSYCEPTFRHAL